MGNQNSSKASTFPDLLQTHPVLIFSATYCSFCNVVKRTFGSLGTEVKSIELNKVEEGADLADQLHQVTRQKTVPQVFICGRWIGGCNDTRKLLDSGELEKMLLECCKGDISCRTR